jgi:hypothetical protein
MLIAIVAILTMLWIFTRSLWLLSTTKAATPVQPSGASS